MTEGVFDLAGQFARPQDQLARAVVLAGGKGTRLAPFTSILPKPLMPIGETSILELVLGQLSASGIREVTLCVGYLSHLIRAVIGNRPHGPLHITYVEEEQALGTAGPLRLVRGLDSTFIAMNGDVLTTLDFNDLLEHHAHQGNVLTIATRVRPIKIDYGVLQLGLDGSSNRVCAYVEKPEMTSVVSMGIYVLEPDALKYVPPEGYFDFPDLVHALLRAEEQVGAYPYDGLWFDIGRRDDYEQAVAAWFRSAGEETEVEPVAAEVGGAAS